VWDARAHSGAPALSVQAHESDVNVMSWNRRVNYMLATGADDGGVRIWDLRAFGSTASSSGGVSGVPEKERPAFVANFQFHRAPVTSVEWARFDGAMLASAAADHTVCVWDLAVERDAEEEAAAMAAEGNNALAPEDTPPQLMFVHQGLRDPKEIHWHHQIPGMCLTTAADGFNAFKAYNVGNEVA
jgi:ribosome assembly protein RRB1